MHKIVCITGLPGAGKSVVSELFPKNKFAYVRFGQIVEDELLKQSLQINEENEKKIREELRRRYGMAAMAILNIPKFKRLLKKGNVLGDGLYSFEEYEILKNDFKKQLIVIAVYAQPELRYKRLKTRKIRPLTKKEAASRDYAEIKNLNKGGTIAMADFTITNTGTLKDLETQTKEVLKKIEKNR